ncbi:antibiotic biosynthesis monooxygenase [Acidocella sp.]|uniref:antibiotic biosynthesis monooxygenase n=1 Tax=Acidocella sp. TaxID=50710 RepID=UPI00261519B3|nr:DUF3291 domain-containing protein [Acidocella sp.]
MPVIGVTRLRLRSIRFLPGFAVYALRSLRQARFATGFLGGSLLNDYERTFWTMTAWDDEAAMRRFMNAGAHVAAMRRLAGWCDEASVVHWQQSGTALPDWAEADTKMREEGRPSRVTHPGPCHANLSYRRPRLTATVPIQPRGANKV